MAGRKSLEVKRVGTYGLEAVSGRSFSRFGGRPDLL